MAKTKHGDSWQQLANIRLAVPGHGTMTVADLLQQVSAADADPQSRNELARQTENLATALEPLPPAVRDEVTEIITYTIREMYERND